MTWAAGTTPVERELSVAEDDGCGWVVSFADGRRFFAWDPDAPIARLRGRRLSGAHGLRLLDHRRGVLWGVRWDVVGPVKDYRSVSILRRAEGS